VNTVVSKSLELSFGVCHENINSMLGFASRCLFGQLARALTKNVLYILGKSNMNIRISLRLKFLNSHNFGPSMTHGAFWQQWNGLDTLFKSKRQHVF
jgi:hypothetical protein